MASNTYLYSTNIFEIWYIILESFSGIMYRIPRRLDLNFLNYNQTRFQINKRLSISNADPQQCISVSAYNYNKRGFSEIEPNANGSIGFNRLYGICRLVTSHVDFSRITSQ